MGLFGKTVLNPEAEPAKLEAVELSRQLLDGLRDGSESDAPGALAAQLHGVDPATIDSDEARIAFWLNLYNALLLNRLRVRPVSGNMLMHPRVFSSSAFAVGGGTYSLNQIEHGVLRRNSPAPFPPLRPFGTTDPRLRAAPAHLDPRIHFALNCGARSCPPIRTYSAEGLDDALEAATAAYLLAETQVEPTTVVLPQLMKLYGRDFGATADRIGFAATYVPAIRELDPGDPRLARPRYGGFDWSAAE